MIIIHGRPMSKAKPCHSVSFAMKVSMTTILENGEVV